MSEFVFLWIGTHGGGRSAIWDPSNNEILTAVAGGSGGSIHPLINYEYLSNCNQVGCVPYSINGCSGGAGGGLIAGDGAGADFFNTDISLLPGQGGTQTRGGYGGVAPPIYNLLNPGSAFNGGAQGGQFQGGNGNSDYSAGGGDGYYGQNHTHTYTQNNHIFEFI